MVSGVSILQLCFNIKIADNMTLEGAGLEGGHRRWMSEAGVLFGCQDREVMEKRVGAREVRENEGEGEESEKDREDREKIKKVEGGGEKALQTNGSRNGSRKGNVMFTGELSSFS